VADSGDETAISQWCVGAYEKPCDRYRSFRRKSALKPGTAAQLPQVAPSQSRTQILALIRRYQRATLAQIQKTTGWQEHSVRGYLSSAAKKHNLQIAATKNKTGDRA
jgi:uncharacterized protein DUF3489